ncbi:MAG TPA: NAD(P)-binding domain-containing protein [Bryobacteraceae bacterium]|jgi:hypothetical protein|nr:NAD(P)-binding domain-containing protein [Bryobacteraceae bacterium]
MNASLTPVKPAAASAKVRAPKSACRMTVIGAGPSGLSATAHLRGAGIETRTFGEPMSFWRGHMPTGMKLRSAWDASNFSAPGGRYSLNEYAATGAIRRTAPIPIEDFIHYGEWFQRQTVPDLDRRKVLRVEGIGDRFRILLEDGERFDSESVVVATGLLNQEFVPEVFRGLPPELVSHTAGHIDLGRFKGQRVAVIGRGQSAVESAALLAESGAEVELISRGEIRWIGWEGAKTMMHWMRAPSGVGPFPLDWLVEVPHVVRLWPHALREKFSKRCLRPAAAGWLAPRMGGVRYKPGRVVVSAKPEGTGIALVFDDSSRASADHVLLATGYSLDVAKPGILSASLLERVRMQTGTHCPALSAHLESSVPGLYFTGASAVPAHGPLLRFVAGVGYSARAIAKGAAARKGRG